MQQICHVQYKCVVETTDSVPSEASPPFRAGPAGSRPVTKADLPGARHLLSGLETVDLFKAFVLYQKTTRQELA